MDIINAGSSIILGKMEGELGTSPEGIPNSVDAIGISDENSGNGVFAFKEVRQDDGTVISSGVVFGNPDGNAIFIGTTGFKIQAVVSGVTKIYVFGPTGLEEVV